MRLLVCDCGFTHRVSRLAGSHAEHREGGVRALRGGGRRRQGCAVHLGVRLIKCVRTASCFSDLERIISLAKVQNSIRTLCVPDIFHNCIFHLNRLKCGTENRNWRKRTLHGRISSNTPYKQRGALIVYLGVTTAEEEENEMENG